MIVICNGYKTCDDITLDGGICEHSKPHEFLEKDCTGWNMDCCNCTTKSYQIFLRNDKIKKINENNL
jgi:hypothetical protein